MSLSIRNKNRVINSARNIFTSAFFQTLLGIVAFVERTVFIKYLNADYLGLNTLFSNVLFVLSIAELGIGSAISFALYKPLADGDEEKIHVYMKFFRKAYNFIGCIIIAVGLLLSPFIRKFANDGADIDGMSGYFIIYLFAIGLTYFFSYKQILIEADQKKYINQIVICLGSILQAILQICILVSTGSYTLYLIVFLICNVGKNIIISIIADRRYPVIRSRKYKNSRMEHDERIHLSTNIKAMCYHKFGEIAVGSSDSILISYLVDLGTLGLYANYQIILEALRSAMRVFYSSVLASIGNMCATEDEEDVYYAFKTLNFTNYILFSFVTVIICNLIQPIITLWLGERFLLTPMNVFLIAMVFYAVGTRSMLLNFHDAYGLFWADKYKRVIEAIVNIVFSIILGKRYGLNGIFIGTLLSNIVGFVIECVTVYRFAFHRSVFGYVISSGFQLIVTWIVIFTTDYVIDLLDIDSLFLGILYRLLVCIVIPVILYVLIYGRSDEFISLKRNAMDMIAILKNKDGIKNV